MNPNTPADLPPSLSDAIDRIMANPELISMVAATLKKPLASDEPPKPQEEPPSASSAATALPALLSSLGKVPHDNDRSRLLCALKPYVNPHRRQTIETLLQLSQMTELIKHLNPNQFPDKST